MDEAFELVSFLTRSDSRIAVLRSLSRNAMTRQELQDATGIPRATLSRTLADCRERALVTRDGHRYRVTSFGHLVADELAAFLDSVASIQALHTLSTWLPMDDLDVSLPGLAGAEVTLPTPIDPMAPVKRAADAVEGGDHVRTFCYSVLHAPILAALQGVVHRGQHLEGVIAAGVLQVVADDPELARSATQLFESGAVELYLYEEGIEPQLIIVDGVTMFLVTDEDGAIQGLVETGDDAVVHWAERTFESLKEAAEPLDRDRAVELLTP